MNSEELIENSENVGAGPVSAQNKNKYNANPVGVAWHAAQGSHTMRPYKINKQNGITLIALIITIIIMLILAGVVLNLTLGEHGIFKTATQAGEEYKKAEIKEEIELAIIDIQKEEIIKGNEVTLETLSNGQLKDKLNGITTILNTNEITGEYKNYDYIIDENLNVTIGEKAGGIVPIFNVQITTVDGKPLNGEETKKAMSINIENISEFGDNYEIEVKDASGNIIAKEENVVGSLTGQASYIIINKGTYTITVTGTKDGKIKTATKQEEISLKIEVITADVKRANGVIDIVWLNEDNTVRSTPLSPAAHLGGLQPITWNGSEWIPIDTNNTDNKWYNYVEQTGNTKTKGTSNWANARSSDENAYFVWIPRYAYKIIYFDTSENAEKYRANKNSKEGIIGYSSIDGILDVTTGAPRLVEGTVPTNVTGKVQDERYSDYIPHPAFEFGGAKAGIWVGKFETTGTTQSSLGVAKITPNEQAISGVSVNVIFTVSNNIKNVYNLTGDTHMMKNTEWGAVAYLAESKYGRNGTEIERNLTNTTTGGGNYVSNEMQSTTGNIYGIYDMSGGSWEYVAGYVGYNIDGNGNVTDLVNKVKSDSKYADVYPGETNMQNEVYQNAKGIKGDAVYETSESGTDSITSWHNDYSLMPYSSNNMFTRGRCI